MPESIGYSYEPPQDVFDNRNSYSEVWVGIPQDQVEVIAPAYLVDRHEYNRIWNEEKEARRRHNESLRDGIFDHGTYYRAGVGQPRG